ncbi:MAG: hypothetical protein QXJ06_00620 [Candidatus Aenigmatarchaeota archaeon]
MSMGGISLGLGIGSSIAGLLGGYQYRNSLKDAYKQAGEIIKNVKPYEGAERVGKELLLQLLSNYGEGKPLDAITSYNLLNPKYGNVLSDMAGYYRILPNMMSKIGDIDIGAKKINTQLGRTYQKLTGAQLLAHQARKLGLRDWKSSIYQDILRQSYGLPSQLDYLIPFTEGLTNLLYNYYFSK